MRFVVEVQTDIPFFQGVQLLETLLGNVTWVTPMKAWSCKNKRWLLFHSYTWNGAARLIFS